MEPGRFLLLDHWRYWCKIVGFAVESLTKWDAMQWEVDQAFSQDLEGLQWHGLGWDYHQI